MTPPDLRTFKQWYLAENVSEDEFFAELDRRVDEWHWATSPYPMQDMLGLNEQEFENFVRDPLKFKQQLDLQKNRL